MDRRGRERGGEERRGRGGKGGEVNYLVWNLSNSHLLNAYYTAKPVYDGHCVRQPPL